MWVLDCVQSKSLQQPNLYSNQPQPQQPTSATNHQPTSATNLSNQSPTPTNTSNHQPQPRKTEIMPTTKMTPAIIKAGGKGSLQRIPTSPHIVFAHDPGRFYSDPLVNELRQMRMHRRNCLNITFCENANEVFQIFNADSKTIKKAYSPASILFIDGRIANHCTFQDLEPGDTMFYSGSKVYSEIRKIHPETIVIIFTTDHREFQRLKSLNDKRLLVLQAGLNLKDQILLIIRRFIFGRTKHTTKPV